MEKTSAVKYVLKIGGAIVRLFLNVLFYAVVVLLIVRIGTYSFDFAYQVFGSVTVASEPGTDVEFQIVQGESTMDIANKLHISRLIKDKYPFYLKTKLKNYSIKPGTFVLNTSMDYDTILQIITDINNSITKEDIQAEAKESS